MSFFHSKMASLKFKVLNCIENLDGGYMSVMNKRETTVQTSLRWFTASSTAVGGSEVLMTNLNISLTVCSVKK